MREEELSKKLESVELPDIELQSHRRRLRMALLDAGHLQRRPGITILDLAKSRVKGGIDTMIRGLVSRQPVWKTAVIGVLAVALIAGLAIALPSLTGQSSEALAASIARNSPEVQAALDGGEVEVIRVVVIDDKATVVLYREEIGQYVLARVDLETAEVTEVAVVSMTDELTEAEKEEAIAIAKADPGIKELLDQGASIDRVTPVMFFNLEVLLDEEAEFAIVKMAHIDLRLGDRMWSALIDLEGKKVIRLDIEKGGIEKDTQ